MIRLVLPALVLLGVVVFWLMRSGTLTPLMRGTADNMLVSTAKPAVAVAPGPGLHLVDARRAEVPCDVSMGSVLANPSVGTWYALYTDEAAPARLVVLMAAADTAYNWPLDVAVTGQFRNKSVELEGFEGNMATYVLTPERDPWRAAEEPPLWNKGSLVRRYTFREPLHRFKFVVEYREPVPNLALPVPDLALPVPNLALPVPNLALPVEDALPELAAFEARALKAFQLFRPAKGAPLPRPAANLPYPPAGVHRTELARFIGPLHYTNAK